jgi:hypothetical protein
MQPVQGAVPVVAGWADAIFLALTGAVRDLVAFVPRLLGALVILLVGWLLARLVEGLVTRGLRALRFNRLADRAEIDEVLARYCRGVDRCDEALLADVYHPDATDDHGRYSGGVDGLIDFFESLGSTLRCTTHQMGPPWIRFADADTALVETYCLYRRETHGSPPEQAVMQGLRYLDRLERRDGRWAIAARRVVLDWEQSGSGAPAVPSGPTWSRGAHGPDDPSTPFLLG